MNFEYLGNEKWQNHTKSITLYNCKKKKHRIYTLQYKTLIHGIRNNSNTISNRIGAWTTRKEWKWEKERDTLHFRWQRQSDYHNRDFDSTPQHGLPLSRVHC